MTAIVTICSGTSALMGADSTVTDDDEIGPCAEPKVWKSGRFLVGVGGDTRYCNLTEEFRIPAVCDLDPYVYMRRVFAPSLRQAFLDDGVELDPTNHINFMGLVVLAGRIFVLDEELGVSERARTYDAIGTGGPYALGALRASLAESEDESHQGA